MAKTKWKLYIHSIGYANAKELLFKDSSIQLQSNIVYGLMGDSGIGKTSLWESLIRYPKEQLQADYKIYRGGELVTSSQQISILPQQPAYTINPTIKAGKSIKDVLKAHNNNSPELLNSLIAKASFPEHLMNKYPHELSGGEVQRLAYAMALAVESQWLILDEPTASLDRLTASKVLESAIDWVKEKDRLCIISSHDGALLNQYCDQLIFVKHKKLDGPYMVEEVEDSIVRELPRIQNSVPDGQGEHLYKIKNGCFSYKNNQHNFALTDINLKLQEQSVIGICGRSGSGKSTLGRLIASYLEWDNGDSSFSHKITSTSDIQYIPQDAVQNFHPTQSLQQQLFPIFKKWNPKSDKNEFHQYLKQISIDPAWLRHSILELSGGQRQRMLLARALIPSPKLIIIDETLSALDLETASDILIWLKNIQNKEEITILLISHDLRTLLSFCNTIHIMSDGRLVDKIIPGGYQNNFNSTVTKALFQSYNI